MHIRDREFDPFAFRINDNALPEVADGYVFQAAQPRQGLSTGRTDGTTAPGRLWKTVLANRLYMVTRMS